MLVAVIESIGFLIADNIVLMKTHVAHSTKILAGGGLSACKYLCECVATLTGLPVTRIREPELTAKGVAWLLADTPGDWDQAEGNQTFHPVHDEPLVKRWQSFRQRIETIKPV